MNFAGAMKTFVVILLLLLCAVSAQAYTESPAGTFNTDGTVSDVASAWSAAADGNIVTLPQGSHTWNSGTTLSGKGVHLKGLGTGATINGTGNPKLTITHDATHHVVLSGLSFNASAKTIHVNYSASGKSIIITNCNFLVDGGQAFRWESVGGGVISRCSVTGDGNFNDQFIQHKAESGGATWTAASTMGSADTTGMVNLYVEDSRFTNCQLQCFDFDDNSRIVVRSNIFVDSAITSHGFSTSISSTRHWEVYSNLWLIPHPNDPTYPNMDYLVFLRGGTGILRYNNMPNLNSQEWGNKAEVKYQEQQLRRTGQSDCPTSYPAPKQLGQSHNGTSSITDPIYIGGNIGTGASSGNANDGEAQDYNDDQCTDGDCCGNGQTMEMGGAGNEKYWREDRDYVLSAIKPGYTPYTYPHPLAAGEGGDPDTTPPTPDPATFSTDPAAASSSSISMIASTASDATGPVEYYFDETTGGAGATDSGWQSSASYTDSGLSASTQYTYRVKARDAAGTPNETAYSGGQNATTSAAAATSASATTANVGTIVKQAP